MWGWEKAHCRVENVRINCRLLFILKTQPSLPFVKPSDDIKWKLWDLLSMNIIVCFVILIRSDCDMRVYFSIVTDAVIVATTWNEIDSKNWRLCDSRLGWDFSTLTWFLSFYFLIINRVILDFNEKISRDFKTFRSLVPLEEKKSEWEDNAWVSSAFIWKYLCNNIIEIKIIWECEHKRELEITSETSCKT